MSASKVTLAFLFASALAGCETTSTAAPTAISNEPNLSVTSGTVYPRTQDAAAIFKRICVDDRPAFKNFQSNIQQMNLVFSPETSAFAHPALDLSVALADVDGVSACSIIFAGEGTHDASIKAFVTPLGLSDTRIFFANQFGPNGRDYVNAQLIGTVGS